MTIRACLSLPAHLQQHGAELLHLQCWLWGCDIRRSEGNLLLEYGFRRQRPPAGATGSSAYLRTADRDTVIVLWGFGAFCGSPVNGGVYLKRYEFAPRYIPRIDTQRLPWLPDQVHAAVIPLEPDVQQQMHRQFISLLEWIAQYETWVIERCSLDYRRECAASWNGPPFRIPVERLIEEWQCLAQQSALLILTDSGI
ncbi:MAG: hypothetical protein RMJ54_13350 [Roseiflexaceae bacterium]|nr:hypothetical protein [Roseiflexaceae bacterium]